MSRFLLMLSGLSRKPTPKLVCARNRKLCSSGRTYAISLSIGSLRGAGPCGITFHEYIVAIVCLRLGGQTCHKLAVWASCRSRSVCCCPTARRSAVRAACRGIGKSPVLVSQWNWNRIRCAGFPHQKDICGERPGHRGGGGLQVNLGTVGGRRYSIWV